MGIRIPTAYEAGFGQKIPEAIPAAVPGYRGEGIVGEAAGQGLEQTGGEAEKLGIQTEYNQGRLDLLNANVAARQQMVDSEKIMRAQKNQEISDARVSMLNIQNNISEGAKNILNDPTLDPAGKQKAYGDMMQKINEQYRTSIPPELYDEFNPVFAAHAYSTQTKLADAIAAKTNDTQMANGVTALTKLEGMAASGTLDRASTKEQAKAVLDTMPITDMAKAAKLAVFSQQVDKNDVLSRLNVMGTDGYHAGLNNVLADLQAKGKDGEFNQYTDLDPAERDSLIKTTQNMIATDANRRRIDQDRADANFNAYAKEQFDRYQQMKLSGVPVPAQMELETEKLAKATNSMDWYNAIKQKGESAGYIWNETQKDPLTFGAARLGMQVPPLNLTDPQALTQGLTERMQIGARVKNNLGLSFTPILTTDEVKGLTGMIKKDPNGAGIDFLDKLTRTVGNQNAMGIAKQISQTDPKLGIVARYVASGDTLTAHAVANGQQLIDTKAITMPKDEDLSAKFYEKAGTALQALPDNGQQVYEAFRAAYANAAQTAGIQGNDVSFLEKAKGQSVNDNLADWAFKQVVGNVIDFHGMKTPIPSDVTEEDFLNSVKRITPDTVRSLGGVEGMSNDEAARKIIDDGRFYMVGNGIYQIRVDGNILLRPDKYPVRFNLKSLDMTHPLSGVNE